MKTSAVRSLLRTFVFLFVLALTASGAWAATANTFILSDEGAGLINKLLNAGYGNMNLYQVLVQIVNDTNPSVSGIITPAFLLSLSNCPPSSPLFTTLLSSIPPGSSVAISDDCTVQFVSIHGASYYNQGAPTLGSDISGVGRGLFTHSADSQTPLTLWQANGNTYNVFAIGWATAQQVPTMTEWGMVIFALLIAASAACHLGRRRTPQPSLP
jgi:hypothetical protein